MIRGIILLILSCVVLTIQTRPQKPATTTTTTTTTTSQPPCTCAEHAGQTVTEHGVDYLPSPALDYVDFPDIDYNGYAQRSSDFYNMVSEPGYVASTSTLGLQNLLAGVQLDLSGIVGLLNDCNLLQLRLQVDIRGIEGIISGLIVELQGSLPLIHGPIPAQNLVSKLLYMLNRKEHLEDALVTVGLHIKLLTSLHEVSLGKILSVEKLLGLSKILDDRILGCNGKSGGLLGSVTGLVGGLLCDKLSILDGLLHPILGIVDEVLNGLSVNLDVYLNILDSCKGIERVGQASDLVSYDAADDAIRNQMFESYGQLENQDCPSYDQVKLRIGTIVDDDLLLSRIIAVLRLQLGPGYDLSNPQLTCSLEDQISCRFTGTLAVNVDVDLNLLGLVKVDLDVGVGLSLNILEILFLALTGSPQFNVVLTTLDQITGKVVIDLSVNEQVHDCMCETYQTVNLHNDAILPKVQQTVQEVTTNIESSQTPDDYISYINEQETIIQQQRDSYGTVYDIQPTIETVQKQENQSCEIAQVDMTNANDSVNCVEICKDRVITSQQNEIDLWQARLENIKQSIIQADENVASSTKELYQAELDRVNHPGDQEYEQACARRHETLLSALEQACIIKEQYGLIAAELEAKISLGKESLVALEADLNLCLDNLNAHVEIAVDQIRINLNLELAPFIEKLTSIFTSIRPFCTLLNPDSLFLNLNEILDTHLSILVQLDDVLGLDETEEDMRACHRNMITGALGGLLQTVDCIVEDALSLPVLKRGGTGYAYNVVIGGSQKQKRDISAYGDQVFVDPELTSSASSLAFSFIMLFAIVSFVFFK